MELIGSLNGDLAPLHALTVPVDDRGFLLGDAVFETLRTYNGRLFALDAHLDRLHSGLRALRMQDVPDRGHLRHWIRDTTQAGIAAMRRAEPAVEAVVRVTVTRGSGPPGMSPRNAGPPRVYVLVRPLRPTPESIYTEGVRVVTATTRRLPSNVQDPSIKAASALNLVLARMEADEAGADEALLCDAAGNYLEATSANLFAFTGRRFSTPRDGVLQGITASIVARILHNEGFEARPGPIPPPALLAANELVLTQTTREIVPVVAVDGRPIGTGRPGPVVARLRALFEKEVTNWLA